MAKAQKKSRRTLTRCGGNFVNESVVFLRLDFHNLLFVIVTAFRANSMTADQFVAIGALDETDLVDFPIRRAGISPRLGHFTLRYCHIIHLLFPCCQNIHSYLLYGIEKSLSTILTNNFFFRREPPFSKRYFAEGKASALVSRAITSSSFVGITSTFTLPPSAVMSANLPRTLFFARS